jgi:hypothetical protein
VITEDPILIRKCLLTRDLVGADRHRGQPRAETGDGQGDDLAPIPGTKRVARVEENTAADGIELSATQVERLNHLTPASGERHDEGNMAVIDR